MNTVSLLRRHAGLIGLIGLLLVGLAIRLVVVDWPGHDGDTRITARWAENMARYGPWNFYEHDRADYQALLYVYWPLGALFDGDALVRAVKGLSIPFDMAMGTLLYFVALRFTTSPRALLAPALYLLNPAVLLAGPVWGQVDAASTLAYLTALLAVAAGWYPAAGGLAVLAMLTKPQAGLVALPVAVVAFLRGRAAGTAAPLARVAVGALVAYIVVAGPLRLDPIRFVERVMSVGALKPSTSLNAPNLWGMLVGYAVPDGPLFWVGAVLLLIGLVVALLPLRRRQDLSTILTVGLFVVFAFYFLPTRVHERYLFPAMALLAPMAAANWRVFGGYLFMTAGFALAILYALVTTTPFGLPRSVEVLLVSRTSALWIGLTLMATAVTLVLLLLRPAARAAEGQS
jgi:dolichyl-phosphate-mannose-protein mannosyltransferase